MSIADSSVRHGYYVGAGAALNVALGFIPKRVDIINITDGTVNAIGFCEGMLPFNTGTVAPALNSKVVGATSGAKAYVKDVIVTSGTWGGGNAAGFIVLDEDGITGTFANGENLSFSNDATGGTDAVTTGTIQNHLLYQSAALGYVSQNGYISPYLGAAGSAAKGFSVTSNLAVSGKLYRWTAYRN